LKPFGLYSLTFFFKRGVQNDGGGLWQAGLEGEGGIEMTDASRSAECRSLPTTAASHLINLHTPDQSRDALP
jgi:hypothetical protein